MRNFKPWSGVLAVVVLAAAMSACSSSTGSSTGTSGGNGGAVLTIDNLGAELIKTQCASVALCGTMETHFISPASCAAMNELGTMDSKLVEAVKAGKVKFDAAAARTCLNALAAICMVNEDAEPAACDQVFTGTLAAGAKCTTNQLCASKFCKFGMSTCGVCAVPPQVGTPCGGDTDIGYECGPKQSCDGNVCVARFSVAAGGACNSTSDCVTGNVCNFDLQQCVAVGAKGAKCKSHEDCASGLRCVASASEGSTCDAPLAAGATCYLQGESSFGQCVKGYVCGIPTNWDGKSNVAKCEPLGTLGGACASHMQCGVDGFCDAGKCALLPGKGGKCAGAMMPGAKGRCATGFACGADGVCGDKPGVGQPCPDYDCAKGLTCDEGTCKAKAKVGEACGMLPCDTGLSCGPENKCVANPTCE